MSTVTIQGKTYPFALPDSAYKRAEMARWLQESTLWSAVAMIGVCVPGLKLRADYYSSRGWLHYAERVGQELEARGVALDEVLEQATVIMEAFRDALVPSAAEAEANRGNSEPPPGSGIA